MFQESLCLSKCVFQLFGDQSRASLPIGSYEEMCVSWSCHWCMDGLWSYQRYTDILMLDEMFKVAPKNMLVSVTHALRIIVTLISLVVMREISKLFLPIVFVQCTLCQRPWVALSLAGYQAKCEVKGSIANSCCRHLFVQVLAQNGVLWRPLPLCVLFLLWLTCGISPGLAQTNLWFACLHKLNRKMRCWGKRHFSEAVLSLSAGISPSLSWQDEQSKSVAGQQHNDE